MKHGFLPVSLIKQDKEIFNIGVKQMDGAIILAQSVVDICAWFLPAFAVMLAVSWVCHLFRY